MSNEMENVDRISLLPDCLLHDILSFLDTKQVVQTCVLSKRWKTVWMCIPTLNFDYNSYTIERRPKRRLSRVKERSFVRFISSVLSRHCGTCIRKLSYSSSNNYEMRNVANSLIHFAQCHMVQELCMDTFDFHYHDWNWFLIEFHSLTVLKISCLFVDDWESIFASCPNLESLVLVCCYSKTSSIRGPKLESLELYVGPQFPLTFSEVELFTPNLRYVKFKNLLPIVKCDLDLFNLDKLDIEIDDFFFISEFTDTEVLAEDLFKFLQVFHNARSLTMPLKALEVLLTVPALFSGSFLFNNLRHLKLKTKDTSKMTDLPISISTYFQNCPTLKSLVVDLGQE